MYPATVIALPPARTPAPLRLGPPLAPRRNQQIVRHAFSGPLTKADVWGRRERR